MSSRQRPTPIGPTLDDERMVAELDHIYAALRCGRHSDLLPSLSAHTAQSPLNERVASQTMIVLHRSGRQADALEHHHRLRRRLADPLETLRPRYRSPVLTPARRAGTGKQQISPQRDNLRNLAGTRIDGSPTNRPRKGPRKRPRRVPADAAALAEWRP
ncbi:BTAD domain-containing putative transcriptional regulator [Nocardia miyunensis]|uniref:BTAD domain-containing putative transcriptional regulator n=1 Tax=Nocardia miyunensis TaxID=282684 RepID=UPI000A0208F2